MFRRRATSRARRVDNKVEEITFLSLMSLGAAWGRVTLHVM